MQHMILFVIWKHHSGRLQCSFLTFVSRWITIRKNKLWGRRALCMPLGTAGCTCTSISVRIKNGLWACIFWLSLTHLCYALVRFERGLGAHEIPLGWNLAGEDTPGMSLMHSNTRCSVSGTRPPAQVPSKTCGVNVSSPAPATLLCRAAPVAVHYSDRHSQGTWVAH